MNGTPHCDLCGEVIGVYEPLVGVSDGQAHESSRALDPQFSGPDGKRYHRACFKRLGEDRPTGARPGLSGTPRRSVVSPYGIG